MSENFALEEKLMQFYCSSKKTFTIRCGVIVGNASALNVSKVHELGEFKRLKWNQLNDHWTAQMWRQKCWYLRLVSYLLLSCNFCAHIVLLPENKWPLMSIFSMFKKQGWKLIKGTTCKTHIKKEITLPKSVSSQVPIYVHRSISAITKTITLVSNFDVYRTRRNVFYNYTLNFQYVNVKVTVWEQ